jgi:hypothetical protein
VIIHQPQPKLSLSYLDKTKRKMNHFSLVQTNHAHAHAHAHSHSHFTVPVVAQHCVQSSGKCGREDAGPRLALLAAVDLIQRHLRSCHDITELT